MKKFVPIVVFLLVCVCSLFAGGAGETYSLTVLGTNDTHGHPLAFAWSGLTVGTAVYNAPMVGGIAARKTYFDQVRQERPNVLVLDAGDVTTGLVVSNYFKAKPDILAMNLAGYHAMSLGNHEFDNGIAALKERMADAKFPFLSANVYDKASGKPFAQPYAIIKLKDVNVAVIGITTPETVTATLPANVAALEFRDAAESVMKLLPELKDKAKFVVVLSHLGLVDDRELAKKLSGVGLILGGHSHSYMESAEVVNDIAIFQAYQWGALVSRIDIDVKDGKIASLLARPVGINLATDLKEGATAKGIVKEIGSKKYDYVQGFLEQDAAVLALLTPFASEVDKTLETVVGEALAAFPDTVNGLSRFPRRDDSALTNMVCDAMREETSRMLGKPVDVFLQNGGGIRAALPAGPITKKAVYAVLPFDNTIQTVSMSGAQLLDLLQKNALPVVLDNYTSKWDSPNGAFLQVSGMSFTIDIAAKSIGDIKIGTNALEPGKTYLVATQNFMMTGGDGYTSLKGLPGMYETSMFQRDAVLAWIERTKTINPVNFENNRINLVNTGR